MASRKVEVIEGQKYNNLTVVQEVASIKIGKHKKRMVLCECSCGKTKILRLEYLRSGHTKSCGCQIVNELVKHRKTHGMTGTRLHGIWNGMKGRCYNNNRKSYKDYGAKGIKVCDEWQNFEPFYEWAITHGYRENLTIDRKDPFGDYEPNNCRWATRLEQRHNRRDSVGAR